MWGGGGSQCVCKSLELSNSLYTKGIATLDIIKFMHVYSLFSITCIQFVSRLTD